MMSLKIKFSKWRKSRPPVSARGSPDPLGFGNPGRVFVNTTAMALFPWLLCSVTSVPLHADVVQIATQGIRSIAAAQSPLLLIDTPAKARKFLADHDSFLFDCDGVLWRGEDGLLPNTVETLALLERLGKSCIFVTNNAAKSRAAYRERFAQLGLERITLGQVVPSSFVAARWLARTMPDVRKAFVVGAGGLVDELRDAGIDVLTARDFDLPGSNPLSNEAGASLAVLAEAVDRHPDVGAVVVGHDTGFDFKSLCLASLFLERGTVAFIATNPDAFDIVAGHRMPGNGCFVASIATVAGRAPDAVCGKPAPDLATYLLSEYTLNPLRTCMIGDRLDTDIALAHAMGSSSLLVLTGVATADDMVALNVESPSHEDSVPLPSHTISHVGRLFELYLESDET